MLIYNWWGLQALDTLQDCTDNSSIDKIENSLEWQEYFSQFQDTTDAVPCHIHLSVCLWIMDPHSRAPEKNTSHGNEVLPQDTTHLIQRQLYQRRSPYQDQQSIALQEDLLTPLVKTILQGTVKRERRQGRQRKRWEDNIREWTGLELGRTQRAVENRGKWRKPVVKSSVVPQRPSRLRDWWWWDGGWSCGDPVRLTRR